MPWCFLLVPSYGGRRRDAAPPRRYFARLGVRPSPHGRNPRTTSEQRCPMRYSARLWSAALVTAVLAPRAHGQAAVTHRVSSEAPTSLVPIEGEPEAHSGNLLVTAGQVVGGS